MASELIGAQIFSVGTAALDRPWYYLRPSFPASDYVDLDKKGKEL
jgi:hypothetical protein